MAGNSKHEKKQAKSRNRLVEHVEKLRVNKIDVKKDRCDFIQSLVSQGSFPHSLPPKLLVLNFSGWKSSIDTFLGSSYSIYEPDTVFEDMSYVKWILKSRDQEPSSSQTHPVQLEVSTSSSSLSSFSLDSGSLSRASSIATSGSIYSSWDDVPDAVLLLTGSTLTVFQELVVRTTFLKGKPVVVLAEGASDEACEEMRQLTAGTWPVFNDSHSLLEYLLKDLPPWIQLRRSIQEDIDARLERHKVVNVTGVAVSRGAVAFIPFGVHTVNTVTLVKLCHQCMVDTGMGADKQARKALMKGAGTVGAFEFACNSASDVYQVLAQGSILAEMFQASSVSAALATLDAADMFLLGSISVVTGAVAAFTAYKTRPQLIQSIGETLTMLQFVHAVNAQLRRNTPA